MHRRMAELLPDKEIDLDGLELDQELPTSAKVEDSTSKYIILRDEKKL